jgi:DNA polymerase III delta prime subunit
MDLRKNLWTHKYGPKKFDDIILNTDIKTKLKKAFNELPNLLLYGTPGIGKGCFANLLIKKENIDSMWINASDETGIDVFRNKINPFANAMCLKELKIVVLNECDSMTSGMQGSQKILRQMMEDTYKLCRFILICNYDSYIIPEIKSRCQIIKFDNPPKKEIGKLCLKILKSEKIKFNTKDVIEIVKKCYPDIRRTINVLQENTIKGKLTGSRINASEEIFDKIFNMILKKDIENVRTELKSNYIPYPDFYEYMYNRAGDFKEPGGAILNIAEHLHRDTTSVIKEINFMHLIVKMIYEEII